MHGLGARDLGFNQLGFMGLGACDSCDGGVDSP